MNFKIQVESAGATWWETYDEPDCPDEAAIRAWAAAACERFNATLRGNETPRSFTGCIEIIGEGKGQGHSWTKMNLVSLQDHRGVFDNVRCTVCDARARRYGMDSIKMQKGFTAKKWKRCPGEPQ